MNREVVKVAKRKDALRRISEEYCINFEKGAKVIHGTAPGKILGAWRVYVRILLDGETEAELYAPDDPAIFIPGGNPFLDEDYRKKFNIK